MSADTADRYSERAFGTTAFARFDPTSDAQRAAARAFHDRLCAIGFGPSQAAALFGLAEISDIRTKRAPYYDAFLLPHGLDGRAARFFALHDPLDDDALDELLGSSLVAFLIDLGAIVATPGGRRSLVSVTWFGERLILADARAYNLIWPSDPFDDYVMPPGGDSIGLLHVAPRTPRRSGVDLCCGAGAQTLAAAAYCERIVGVDINPRALRFAQFNAAANAVDNVRFVHGDCFEPLGIERFDAILANPPFVPWPSDDAGLLYRGGGEFGDDVIARILAGATTRLEPGGSLSIVADYANTDTLPQRIAAWQGGARRTLLLLQHAYDVVDYAESHAGHRATGPEREREIVRLLAHFAATGIQSLGFGYLLQDGMPGNFYQTHSRAPRDAIVADDVAHFFTHLAELDERLRANAPLVLAPGLRVVGEVIKSATGTAAACYVRPGPASMLEESTLSRTAFAILDRIATSGGRPEDFAADPDARATLRGLLERGFVRFTAL